MPLQAAYKADGSVEWWRLDHNGKRIVVRRQKEWERLGFRSAEHFDRWQRGLRL